MRVTGFVTDESHPEAIIVFVPTGLTPPVVIHMPCDHELVDKVDIPVEKVMRTIIPCGAGSVVLTEGRGILPRRNDKRGNKWLHPIPFSLGSVCRRSTTAQPLPSRLTRIISPLPGKMSLKAVITTWWVTKIVGVPRSASFSSQVSSAASCTGRCCGRPKKEFTSGSSLTSPRSRSSAVSIQRNHWLV